MDFDALEKEAVLALGKIPLGQVFLVRDLFEGYRWEAISNGNRRDFGKHFKRRMEIGAIQGLKYAGKAQNGSAKYIKTEVAKV